MKTYSLHKGPCTKGQTPTINDGMTVKILLGMIQNKKMINSLDIVSPPHPASPDCGVALRRIMSLEYRVLPSIDISVIFTAVSA
jgi:hypothetical protein